VFLVLPAFAAESTFVGADAAGQAFDKPVSHLAASLGGAFTSGNTRTYTLNATLTGDHRWHANKVGADMGANLGRSVIDADADGHIDPEERDAGWTETARKAWVDARYDRYVGKRDSLYTLGGALVDPFAGYDSRSHVQLGYSRVLVQGKALGLVAELGADGAYEDFVEGVEPPSAWVLSVRAMVGTSYAFNTAVSFTDKLELYENVLTPVDIRVLNGAQLTSKLADRFSLSLTHSLTFDNQPVEGYQKLDHTVTVAFVASIL
jgi:putative salt-induced outer membrane protein YdiY